MKITFCFGGKKRFAAALLAAAMALFLLFGCSSGGDDDPGEIPQNPGINQGGGQNPSEGENQGGESEEGGNTISAILKEIMETEYTTISGSISNTNITLTAQTIDKIFEIYPDLEKALANKDNATKYNEAKTSAKAKINLLDNNAKKALIAKVEEKLTITRENTTTYPVFLYTKSNDSINYDGPSTLRTYSYNISTELNVSLSGKFDISNIYITSLSDTIKFSDDFEIVSEVQALGGANKYKAMYVSELKKLYDNLHLSSKDVSKLPKLNFVVYINDSSTGLKHFLYIYEKYNETKKMQITGDFSSTPFDGSKLVDGITNYTLFSSDNTEKTSGAPDIKSMDINTLVKFSNKYNVKDIKNIIVSGNANSGSSVNWTNLTNVIFEEDMSNLKIVNKTGDKISLNGIVYFKDSPYNSNTNTETSLVKGALKLDKMSDTIKVKGDGNGQISFVLDISSITNLYNNYQGFFISSMINAVYFNADQKQYKEDGNLYKKIIDLNGGVIDNIYFGGERNSSDYSNINKNGVKTSDKARTLKEFEQFGNEGHYSDGKTVAKNIDFIRAEGLIPRRFAS